MISKENINNVIRDLYLELLEEDELDRVSPNGCFDWKSDEFARDHLEHLGETDEEIEDFIRRSGLPDDDHIRDSIAENDADYYSTILKQRHWDDMADWADELIRKHDLDIDKDTDDYRRLCLYAARAVFEARRTSIRRGQGDWSTQSTDPLFQSSSLIGNEPAKERRKAPPIDELVDRFFNERKGLSPKHADEFRVSIDWMVEYFGTEKTIADYSVHDIVEYKDALLQTPTNFRKFFREKTIKQAIELNKAAERPVLSVGSINNKRLGNIDTFFAWAAKNAYIESNPAAGIRVDAPKRGRGGKRDPFSIEQLQTIFDAPHFTRCKSSARWRDAGNYMIRDHRFWLPLMALWTGARLGELAQLGTDDAETIDGILAIRIRPSEEDGPEGHSKHLKNIESERDVPVHPALLDLGFANYVNERIDTGDRRLFPLCELGADGTYSPFSKHFRRVLDSVGIKKRNRSVFHSFRHSFEDAMRQAGLEDSIRFRLAGRTLRHSSEIYGQGYSTQRLFEEIQKIDYRGLDLSKLSPLQNRVPGC
ncbi:MAG: site-specific integrase [Rhodospirillales bacterium]